MTMADRPTQTTTQTTAQRSIALVSGYHPCSFPPRQAYDAGLKYRFAIILSTYRPDKDGMFFDADLFMKLTDAILHAVEHDSVEIQLSPKSPRLHSLSELQQMYANLNEMDRDPPHSISLYSSGRPVATEETESWAHVGGPPPYHDSFTFSFYTPENCTIEFRQLCEAVCRANSVNITAFHEGAADKKPFAPWWRKPLAWLGMTTW